MNPSSKAFLFSILFGSIFLVFIQRAFSEINGSRIRIVCFARDEMRIHSMEKEITAIANGREDNFVASVKAHFPGTELHDRPNGNFLLVSDAPVDRFLLRRIDLPSHKGTPSSVLTLIAGRNINISTASFSVGSNPHSSIDLMSQVELAAFHGTLLDAILSSIPGDYPRIAANIALIEGQLRVFYHGPAESTPQLSYEELQLLSDKYIRPALPRQDFSDPISQYPDLRQDSEGLSALNIFGENWNIDLMVECVSGRPLSYAQRIALKNSKAASLDTMRTAATELALILDNYMIREDDTNHVIWVEATNRIHNLLQHPMALGVFEEKLDKLPDFFSQCSVGVCWPNPCDLDPFSNEQRLTKVSWKAADVALGEYLVKGIKPLMATHGVICALSYSQRSDETVRVVRRVGGKLVFGKRPLSAVMTIGNLKKSSPNAAMPPENQ